MPMNFSKIRTIIERNRVLTGMSSLPVIIENDHGKQIIWFNFFIKEDPDKGDVADVSSIFSMDSEMGIKENPIKVSKTLSFDECEMPKLNEIQYYKAIEQIYEEFDPDAMEQLITDGVLQPLIPIYREVLKQIGRRY